MSRTVMTTRTSRAVRSGLCRIVSDPKASRGMRMKAIQLLLAIEGMPMPQDTNGTGPVPVKSDANSRRLKELADKLRQGRSENVERDHRALPLLS